MNKKLFVLIVWLHFRRSGMSVRLCSRRVGLPKDILCADS